MTQLTRTMTRRRPLAVRAGLAGLAAAAALAAAGCTDVTTEPRSDISSSNVWADPTSYQSAIAKLYGTLALSGQTDGGSDIQGIDPGFGQYLRVFWNMQELPTDEAIIAWNDAAAGVQPLNRMDWNGSNGTITAMYARILLQARLATNFLSETTDEKLNARGVSAAQRTEIQRYRAEARFLRALSYWHGLDFFGKMPLVTDGVGLGSVPAESDRAALYTFVVSELQAIRSALPAASRADASQYGRANQAAVDMLLAKVYLNAQAYGQPARADSALVAAQRVIASGAYQLDDKYQEIFLADNHTSPEVIFAVPQDGARTRTYGGMTFIIHASFGPNICSPFPNCDDSRYNGNGAPTKTVVVDATRDLGMNGGWYGLRGRREFGQLFSALPTDVRGGVVTGLPAIVNTQGQSLTLTGTIDNYGEGYRVHKYRNVTSTGRPGSDLEFMDVDFPMFRLADAHLIYAEAVLRNGGGTRAQAVQYVNALRTRANAPTIGDADLTLGFILDERARELFWEGHRRTDLIRFGQFTGATRTWQFKGGTAQGQATDAKFNLYPIPDAERAANPGLTQNTGY